jgi:hypothetical protein
VVRGLYAKQEPAILEIREEGLTQGHEQGLTQGIVALCTALDIPLDSERRTHMQALDVAGLEALLSTISTQRRWP